MSRTIDCEYEAQVTGMSTMKICVDYFMQVRDCGGGVERGSKSGVQNESQPCRTFLR
jgi:hypothetical protein